MATRFTNTHFLEFGDPSRELSWFRILWLFVLMATLSSVGCVNVLDQDSGVSERNEKIAARVKVALAQAPDLDAAPIDIKAHDGVVALGGFVEKESQREQVTKVVENVPGVQSVINNIQIK